MDSKEGIIQKSGVVKEALPNTHFKVELDSGKEVIAHLAGKLRMYRIRVLPGDKVDLELNSEDSERGRIVYRRK